MRMNRAPRKLKRATAFDVLLTVFFCLVGILMLYPLYHVIIVSLSNTVSYASHIPYVLPYTFDLTGYKAILMDKAFLNALGVTLFVTIVGTTVNMLMSVVGAYVLSKQHLLGRNVLLGLILFTMLFGGGLIPTYLVNKSLGFVNNIWVMIIPCAINTYYLIIMKNYFTSLPQSLLDAALIDGANEWTILFKVVIPISMPFMATFALFYAVERWNEWGTAMIYINKTALNPLQIYLRNVLISSSSNLSSTALNMLSQTKKISAQSVQMAAIVVTTFPVLCIYPFVQKHFVKGVMVGSVKG